jgi:hypothetical protein
LEKAALKGMFASGNVPVGVEYKMALTDILQTFPYFQLAQVLFAKQMYDTHEPEASGRIKLASVYAPDRKAMYLLFKTPTADSQVQPISNKGIPSTDASKNQDKTGVKFNYIYSSSTTKSAEVSHVPSKTEVKPVSPPPPKEPLRTEVFIREESEAKLPIKALPEKPVRIETEKAEVAEPDSNKKEAIGKPIIEKKKVEQVIAKATITPPVEKILPAIIVKTEEKKPEIEKTTVVQPNASIKEIKKPEPEIALPITVNEPISDNTLKYSFTAWLKVIPEISIANKEPVKPVSQKEKSILIDSFLKKAPSISRPKAEFFSSVKAAKMSIVDDENLVSETLAKIYIIQGNFQKALKAYQTLLIQFPEKKNIFAPRIEEIKALVRENTKPAN